MKYYKFFMGLNIFTLVFVVIGYALLLSSCTREKESSNIPSKTVYVVKYDKESDIDKNPEWKAIYKADTEGDTLMVEYTDEIGLNREKVKCKVVFESNKQYKFVSPWIDGAEIAEKTNTFNLKVIHTAR